jgi:hypothetical protein
MASSDLAALLTALRDRDIPLGKDDIAWASENQKSRLKASTWVQEYLQPATLLTKDELDL